jgi:hypothetical protein
MLHCVTFHRRCFNREEKEREFSRGDTLAYFAARRREGFFGPVHFPVRRAALYAGRQKAGSRDTLTFHLPRHGNGKS